MKFTRVGDKRPTPNDALAVIRAFHKAGWVHGDARVPNIVRDTAGTFLIDMATARVAIHEDIEGRQEDFAQYARSYMGLPMWNYTVGWRSAFTEHPRVTEMIDRLIKVEIEGEHEAILSELAAYLRSLFE